MIGILVGAAIGGLTGAISYSASVLIEGLTTGNWEWNLAEFLGSTVGGLVGGAFSIIPGVGGYISAFVSGFATTVLTDAFSSAIYGTEFDIFSSIGKGFLTGLFSLATSTIMSKAFSVKGVTSKRGNWSAISDQIYTKFRRDIIRRVSLKTFSKMLGLSLYESIIDTVWSGVVG